MDSWRPREQPRRTSRRHGHRGRQRALAAVGHLHAARPRGGRRHGRVALAAAHVRGCVVRRGRGGRGRVRSGKVGLGWRPRGPRVDRPGVLDRQPGGR